jgi:signal transduction histidine kinase
VWNTEGAVLEVEVVPPFRETWWFYALSSLLVAGIVFLAYQYRVSRLRRAHAAQAAFSRQLIESQEAERKRIAAELHDSLGQNLLVIKNRALLGLKLAEDKTKTAEQFDEITASATQALSEVREISYNLRPYHLDRLGLTDAVEAMIEKVAEASAIRFSTKIAEIDRLFSKEAEINFYRIAQEAVNNIVKHSGATEARIEIAKDGRAIYLMIEDNGKGFAVEETFESNGRGFGLTGIAERVQILGGSHTIRSAPGQGTSIKIKINLPDERRN